MDRSIESGFSLVEICIGILIVGLTATLIMSFSRNSYLMHSEARGSEEAMILAEEKYTELLAEPFPLQNGLDTITAGNLKYTLVWSIKDTGFIKRALILVKYGMGKNEKTVKFTGALN